MSAAACVDLQSQACIGHIKAAVEGMGLLPYSAQAWNGLLGQSAAVQQQAQRVRALMQLQAWQVQNCQGLSGAACSQKLAAADQAVKDKLRTSLDVLQMAPLAGNALTVAESLNTLVTGMDLTGQDASRVMAMVNLLTVGVAKNVGTAGKVLNAADEARDTAKAGERLADDAAGAAKLSAPPPTKVTLGENGLRTDFYDANGNPTHWVNPLTGKLETIPADAKIHQDHIFPKKEIADLPGFKDLTTDQQRQILEDPRNFQPMTASTNCSKGRGCAGAISRGKRTGESSCRRAIRVG